MEWMLACVQSSISNACVITEVYECISFPALRCNEGKKNKFRIKHSQYKNIKYVSLSRHYTNKSVH